MAGFAGLAYGYLGEIAKLRSVIAAAEGDLAAPGVSVRDRYVFLSVRLMEAFLSGAFQVAEEATATLNAEENTSPWIRWDSRRCSGSGHSLVSGDADAVRKWDERMNQTPTFVSRMRANQLPLRRGRPSGRHAGTWMAPGPKPRSSRR